MSVWVQQAARFDEEVRSWRGVTCAAPHAALREYRLGHVMLGQLDVEEGVFSLTLSAPARAALRVRKQAGASLARAGDTFMPCLLAEPGAYEGALDLTRVVYEAQLGALEALSREERLDQALQGTFPASDPVALTLDEFARR